jgi:serine/threonine protein kinase/tetratricopeptide (TPR) repeat protein
MRCPECQTDNTNDSRFCKRCATPLPIPENEQMEMTTWVGSPSSEALTPGSTFAGRYLVIEEIGRGGMGRVYKALDQEINEKVSLKLIKPEIAAHRGTIERFQNEIRITRRITHKNVCRMYHLGKDNGHYYITMEYVSGENLKSMIRMNKELRVETALSIAHQICEGLAEAHRLGIIHRDLKPHNIMIDEEGIVRIMDFGIARSIETKGATAPGVMIGTPEYMSPEQVEGGDVDARSDIYALGVILFEMLTGKPPFAGDTALNVAFRHKTEAPSDPRTLNPQVPPSVSRVVLKCLEKQKEKRFQSASELHGEIKVIEQTYTPKEVKTTKKVGIAQPRLSAFPFRKVAVATIAILAVIAAGIIAARWIAPRISPVSMADRAKVAVISFENHTGDKAYDYLQEAIPNLLITSLEQSRFIRVTSWERLHDLLRQTGKEDRMVIDRDLGFELCRLDGIQAIVIGSFTKAGDTFVTDAKILDVQNKNLLKSVSSRGEGVDSILKKQIDDLSQEITKGFGDIEPVTVAKASPITEVTTNSLDAYHYFLRGREEYERFYLADAQRFLERAVELDPEFATAHAYLVRVQFILGNAEAGRQALDNLQKYGKKVTGKEGLYIKALLAFYVDQNRDKYAEILKQIIAEYPEEKRARLDLGSNFYIQERYEEALAEIHRALELDPEFGMALNMLAYTYARQKKYDLAINYFREYAAVSPGDANPHDSLGDLFFSMGKLDEAIAKYKEAILIKPDFGSQGRIAYIYLLKDDFAEAKQWIDQYIAAAASNGVRLVGYQLEAICHHLQGKVTLALASLNKAEELASAENDFNMVNQIYRLRLYICYDWKNYDQFISYARQRYEYRAEHKVGSEPFNLVLLHYYEGLFNLKKGRLDVAKSKLAEVEAIRAKTTDQPDRGNMDTAYRHLLSEILATQGMADEAVAEYGKINRVFAAIGNIFALVYRSVPFLEDFAAQAYVKKGEREKAIAEYERFLSQGPEERQGVVFHPLARYRLARLYEQKGEPAKAMQLYERLAAIWQEADQDLVEPAQVKRRLAALKGS